MEQPEEIPPSKPSPSKSNNSDSVKKNKIRGKKRKRESSTSTDEDDVLPENTLEFENNLQATALKNNLDDQVVKKILKKVVTNDHVLALVKLREEELESTLTQESVQPKLTRAKAKELMKASPQSAPWNLELTPIKHIPVKTRPEVKALIAQELPEDEDDEEYKPTLEDVASDDDHATSSDIDSQPATPATPKSANKTSPKVVTDGPFKVPQETVSQVRKQLDLEEEATIALRTRSKLSLSETPIEHIESSFVPPDDIPLPDVDYLWTDFLESCLNPIPSTRNEDDDEADPEYNVAADPDAGEEDEETLENSLIKISKKELNDLVTELFNVMPEPELTPLLNVVFGNEKEVNNSQWEGKQEPKSDDETPCSSASLITFERNDNVRLSIGKIEPVENNEEPASQTVTEEMPPTEEKQEETETLEPPPVLHSILNPSPETLHVEIDGDDIVTPQQILLLQQQLRMHIQICTSNFLQLFVHPTHWSYAPKYKEYLESLNNMVISNAESVANVCNLKPALDLINSWETSVSQDTPENAKMVEFLRAEEERYRRRSLAHSSYIGEFPDLMKSVVANSPVFLYPHLLPAAPFRPDVLRRRNNYLPSEEQLIVIGLDQFWTYVEDNPEIYKPPRGNPRHRWGLTATIELICKYMFPWVTMKTLSGHIQSMRKVGDKNHPIKRFFANRFVDTTKHKLIPFNPELTLYQQPENEMPMVWVRYLAKSSKRFRTFLYKKKPKKFKNPEGIEINTGTTVESAPKRPLPIEFVKTFPQKPINIAPMKPNPPDKVDVHIQNEESETPQMYQVINIDAGTLLVPIKLNPNSDVTNLNPQNSKANTDSIHIKPKPDHCICCVLLRKICKYRQKRITEYIKKFDAKVICPCKSLKHPKISNKLKLLLRTYKSSSLRIFDDLREKIWLTKKKNNNNHMVENNSDLSKMAESNKDFAKDLAFVTMFKARLCLRQNKVRNQQIKRSLFRILSQFKEHTDDPMKLMDDIYNACDVDLADMYKEFLGFLTAEQADKIDKLKDYFVHNCMEDLIKKTEEIVTDRSKKLKILEYLLKLSNNNATVSCVTCSDLLDRMRDYPELARYCFSLFPHRRKALIEMEHDGCNENHPIPTQTPIVVNTATNIKTVDSQRPIDIEFIDASNNVDSSQAKVTNSIENDKTHIFEDPNTQSQANVNINNNTDKEIDENSNKNETCTQINGDINMEDTQTQEMNKDECVTQIEDMELDKKENDINVNNTIAKLNGDDTGKNIDDDEMEQDGALSICEESNTGSDCIIISDEESNDKSNLKPKEISESKSFTEFIASIKKEQMELTTIKSEVDDDEQDEQSRLYFVPDDDLCKEEPIEWKRDEDKIILEVLKQHLSPEERKDKTIFEIIEEKAIPQMISESLSHKSLNDVRDRIFYLLQILLMNELNE
ncbi:uncharacterized protein LOC123698896 isoform X1 [Colias croceus]|uniref:uncharacterized protein LOC123698896 isoform X1 n=1 Tax=Colias crocea TaxID=72248 RepID=UPI001E27BE66|nr:uncharacterized protein LOC123698896 isoform X1 [Colias croceus]